MERRAIAIEGIVQGVGFRPFVYELAGQFDLGGFVKNRAGGVQIEVEGSADPLDRFLSELVNHSPPLAQIDALSWDTKPPLGERRFRIEASDEDAAGPIAFAPDVATCEQCLAEMRDRRDRRFQYSFINCTNCGPRLTIVTGAPYDRARTTMSAFTMCPACRAEYEDPRDRRFHAQANACPVCGPRLALRDAWGEPLRTENPLAALADALSRGKIGAVKGLGGYHLVCDAGNAAAVAMLRQRKHRYEKPLAVMVRDEAAAGEFCELTPAEERLLTSRRRPIVLLRKRGGGAGVADQVAPENPCLGLMLPYTPLHHLLLAAVGGRPLVMTSGNRSEEPIAYADADAVERLGAIADLFLTHDRAIHVRCDDSVTRVIGGVESPVRRSRGFAPQAIALPMRCPGPILAVGGQLKAAFALGGDRRAVMSHHLGDLDHPEAYRAFERDIGLYERLFSLTPVCIAHDPHPDYASTRYAMERAAASGMTRVAVQHHHAHMASCMAEHGLSEKVIGVTFDGTGYGTDGCVWGGEFLVGDCRQFIRAARLRYVGMPGGERAVREPWRMAAAHLADAGAACQRFAKRQEPAALRTLRTMLERRINTPMTSSAGRLFDAVASLAGVKDRVSYEGQAAIRLEHLAADQAECGAYPFAIEPSDPDAPPGAARVVDTRPMIRAAAADVDAGVGAATIAKRFHDTMADIIVSVCALLRDATGLDDVVLSGGVFMNALLARQAQERLRDKGLRVFVHHKVPPNDGGLSLGQLAVAAAQADAAH